MNSLSLLLLVPNINEFGKARANPFASADNNLKLFDTCECDDLEVCRNAIFVQNPTTKTLVSIDFNGVTYTTDAPVKDLNGDVRHDVLGAKTLTVAADVAAITAWLVAIASIYEVDPKVVITALDPDVLVIHYGAYAFENLVTTGPALTAEDRCCRVANFTQYKYAAEGAIGDIDWNNAGAQTLANNPYDYVGDPATDAATAATLEADLSTVFSALDLPNDQDISVSVDDVAGKFVMTVWTTSTIAPVTGATRWSACAAEVRFTCALFV